MRQRSIVLDQPGQVSAVEPAVATGAPDEMLGLGRRDAVSRFADVAVSRNVSHRNLPVALMVAMLSKRLPNSSTMFHAPFAVAGSIAAIRVRCRSIPSRYL